MPDRDADGTLAWGVVTLSESTLIEALAVQISLATQAGDLDRARNLADLQGLIVARMSREVVADTSAGRPAAVSLPGREQLARIARRISTEALAAELAAERGDWDMVHATYERLAGLFAEYRLTYVQCLGPASSTE